jgi:hypothetical protein
MGQQPDFAFGKCDYIEIDTSKARYLIGDDTRQQRAAKPDPDALKNRLGIIEGDR